MSASHTSEVLVIPKSQQYEVDGTAYFWVPIGNVKYRDLNRDLALLTVHELQILAKAAKLRGFSKMRKQDLFDAVAPLVAFEGAAAPRSVEKDQLPPQIAQLKRKAWRPVAVEGDGPLAASKFSGSPCLKSGEKWPTCGSCAQPLAFFLQLDLGSLPFEMRVHHEGGGLLQLLQLFYCTKCDDYEPFSKSHLVRIISAIGVRGECSFAEPIPAQTVTGWEEMNDYPNMEEAGELGVDSDTYENYPDLLENYPQQGDKLGGWPAWVQGIEYPNCPVCSARMRYLFQLDSEYNLKFMFGDSGCGHISQCPQHKEQLAFTWACC